MNKLEFEKVLSPLIEIVDSIELDLIYDILSRIDNYSSHKGTLKWYTDKLAELKLLDKDNLKVFKKNKKALKKAIENIAKECGGRIDNLNKLQDYYNQGKIDVNPLTLYDSVAVNNLINNAIKDTNDIMDLIETKALEGAKEGYKQILNKAYVETASGVYTYTEAIRRATNEFTEKGIQTVHYENGRSISIEAVVRRDVITRMNKLVGDVELQHAKDLGTNLVYVDQHLGARVRNKYMKHDYEAHAEWQGKKYMIEGSSSEYPNLYEATGYGEMLGLKGINCYHNMEPTWEWEKKPKQIDLKKNEEEYRKLSTKRTRERYIREIRRKIKATEILGDEFKLKKLKETSKTYNKEYDKWLEENNMKRDYSREYVSNNIKNNSWFDKLSKQEQIDLKEYISSGSYKINEALYNNRKLTSEQIRFRDSLDNALKKAPKYEGYVNRSIAIYNKEQLFHIIEVFNNTENIGNWNSYISSSKKIYDESMKIQMKIKSKTGRDLSSLNDEGGGEILFERTTKFKLLDYQKKNGKIYVDLEEIE